MCNWDSFRQRQDHIPDPPFTVLSCLTCYLCQCWHCRFPSQTHQCWWGRGRGSCRARSPSWRWRRSPPPGSPPPPPCPWVEGGWVVEGPAQGEGLDPEEGGEPWVGASPPKLLLLLHDLSEMSIMLWVGINLASNCQCYHKMIKTSCYNTILAGKKEYDGCYPSDRFLPGSTIDWVWSNIGQFEDIYSMIIYTVDWSIAKTKLFSQFDN